MTVRLAAPATRIALAVPFLRRAVPFNRFGRDSRIRAPVLAARGVSGIAIGARVLIQPYAYLEAVPDGEREVLTVGDGTYVGHFARITAMGTVIVGNDVLISDRVYICDTGHEYEDISVPIKSQGLRSGRRLEVADGAWIGIGASIVGNVRIGRGAVVGTNAVVRQDVPDHAVVIGDPARIVRYHDGTVWRSGDPSAL